VQRNRIKRTLREVFRCDRDRFPPASDVVVVALATSAGLGFEEVRREVLGCVLGLREAP
jgi:ribonuclease P protein component